MHHRATVRKLSIKYVFSFRLARPVRVCGRVLMVVYHNLYVYVQLYAEFSEPLALY